MHSIHNKWELTFAVKTNFGHFEQKLLNISRRIDSFELEEPTVEFVEDERKEEEEETQEDRIFRLVNEHWDGLANLLRRRSNALLHRLRDYRSDIFHERRNIADDTADPNPDLKPDPEVVSYADADGVGALETTGLLEGEGMLIQSCKMSYLLHRANLSDQTSRGNIWLKDKTTSKMVKLCGPVVGRC